MARERLADVRDRGVGSRVPEPDKAGLGQPGWAEGAGWGRFFAGLRMGHFRGISDGETRRGRAWWDLARELPTATRPAGLLAEN